MFKVVATAKLAGQSTLTHETRFADEPNADDLRAVVTEARERYNGVYRRYPRTVDLTVRRA